MNLDVASNSGSNGRIPPAADLHSITAYKLTLVALVCEYCKWRRSDTATPTAQARQTASCLLLRLLFGPEHSATSMTACLTRAGLDPALVSGLATRVRQLYSAGPEGLAELVGGAELLIVEHGSGRAPIACSSVVGLFLRAVILAYARLSFHQTAQVFEDFSAFCRRFYADCSGSKAETQTDDESALSELSLSESAVNESLSRLRHSVAPHTDSELDDNDHLPSSSLQLSSTQASHLISSQLQLLVLNETACTAGGQSGLLPAPQLCELMSSILRQCPPSVSCSAHFTAMLACTRARELSGALHALYQSLDGARPAGYLWHAPLSLAALHARFGHGRASRAALLEALTMARDSSWSAESGSQTGVQLVIAWLSQQLEDQQVRAVLLRRGALAAAASLQTAGESPVAESQDRPSGGSAVDGGAALSSAADSASLCLTVLNYVRLLSDTGSASPSEQLRWLSVASAAASGEARSRAAIEATRAAVLARHGLPSLALLSCQLLLYNYRPPLTFSTVDSQLDGNTSDASPLASSNSLDCRQVSSMCRAVCYVARCMADDGHWTGAERCLQWAEKAVYARNPDLITCRLCVQCERALSVGDCGAAQRLSAELTALDSSAAAMLSARAHLLLGRLSCAEQLVTSLLNHREHEVRVSALTLLAEIYCAAGEPSQACDTLIRASTLCTARSLSSQRWHVLLRQVHVLWQLRQWPEASRQLAALKQPVLTHGSCAERARLHLLHALTLSEHSPIAAINHLRTSCELLQSIGAAQLLKRVAYQLALLCQRVGDLKGRNVAAALFRHTVNEHPGVNGAHLHRTLY